MYVPYPLSLRNVEDLLFERGIDISHATAQYWWNRFGPLFLGGLVVPVVVRRVQRHQQLIQLSASR